MKSFSIDWLGRSGPQHLVVDMPLDDARKRLEMSLVGEDSESWGRAMFETNRRYSGKVHDDAFDLIPLWRNRRFRPTLTGRFEPIDERTTRVFFQIDMDSRVLLPLIIAPCVGLFVLIGIFLIADEPWRLLPFGVFMLIVPGIAGGINTLFARYESSQLLQFFVGLFDEDRIN